MAALTFDTRKFDRKLKKGIAKSKKKLDKIFDEFYKAVARIGAATGFNDEQKEFKLSDHPQAEKAIEKALGNVVGQVTSDIEEGVTDAWDTSNAKNDALMRQLAAVALMPSNLRKKATKASMSALAAFQQRKVNGMNLSQRVWKTQENVIPQIELALELGLAEGKSAAALSRDVRQNLKDPQRLFRRVRDKYGVLRLSKAAKACHPGQGVYRSSYKNALRLTATETNMAYRSADHAQEQQMPFVLGIEIHTSDNHPVEDICDELKGVYPKEFKFTGWHPFCRCFTTTKLPTREELSKWAQMTDEDRAKYHFTGEVRDMPKQFTDWTEKNAQRLENAKNKPYFITDNYVDGEVDRGLKFGALTPEDKTRRKEIAKEAKETIRNVEMHNPDFSEPITISGGKINEWLNQPFGNRMEYLAKNEILLDMPNVIATSRYLGDGDDRHDKRIKIHLFEKKIEGRNGWIIVRKEVNGKPFVYSITDSPNILKYLIHKK